MTDRPDIAGLVGARICHDLISPIGAIGNGVELLGLESGPAMSPELALIAESAAGASAKLRFLRIAFGHAGSGQSMSAAEIRGILASAAPNPRLRYDWRIEEPVPRPEVRCALLAALCLQSAMPMGGVIEIAASAGIWSLLGRAETLRMESGLWTALAGSGEPEGLTPGNVHFALLPAAARGLGRRVQAAQRSDGIVITF